VNPRILWAQLGWRECEPGSKFNPSGAKKVSFLVIAPWCPDCRDGASWFRAQAKKAKGSEIWVVGEFAPLSETLAFKREFGISWPALCGTREKSELARNEARFRALREAAGDTRKWGLPLWIQGRLKQGWLTAERLAWP
jgi:hypothetical protein